MFASGDPGSLKSEARFSAGSAYWQRGALTDGSSGETSRYRPAADLPSNGPPKEAGTMPVQTPQRVRVASPQRRINRPSPRPLDGQISRSVRTAPVRREEHLLFVRYRRDGDMAEAARQIISSSAESRPLGWIVVDPIAQNR